MPTTPPLVDSVPQLLDHLDEVRLTRRENCVRLLQELTPHLHAARAVQRELDRHLARRFNAFRYLRTDELGLSRIIAELLDPTAEHGQGATYLDAMIKLLDAKVPRVPDGKIRVLPEHMLPNRRRIDILVEIPTNDGLFCLAFENKPYADDQSEQCKAYLEYLASKYGDRFLLVYLPRRYRMPDESSLSAADHERWKEHFSVLPYAADQGDAAARDDAGDKDVADAQDGALSDAEDSPADHGASLADWFGTCCKLTDPERLRWFLREAQLYCQRDFGDLTMTDTGERYIREYLGQNPRHLHAAFAMARAWPAVKHDVCRRFLEHLRTRVEERVEERVRREFPETPEIPEDFEVRCHYRGKKKWWSSYLCVYRRGWVQLERAFDLGSDGRTAVVMTCGAGPDNWHWGVFNGKNKNDMSEQERDLCNRVESALKEHGLSLGNGDHSAPQYQSSARYQNWSEIVPELGQELADGGGKITDHFVDGLLGIAATAIPAIDEVERTRP